MKIQAISQLLRTKQWIKNSFIFMPLVFGQKLFEYPFNLKALYAFFLFSFISSCVYLINDIFDIEKDKSHPVKKHRPIASGLIGKKHAWIIAFILSAISIFLSINLEIKLGFVVLFYLVLNFIYTIFLKNIVIIDVFCLSVFFLLRIIAGTVVVNVEFSYWMIFMIMLLAMFLGFNKRRQELQFLQSSEGQRVVLGEYSLYFIDQMISVLTSSIVIVYMLYTIDARTVREFGTDHLYYSIPFVYYGIFRYLYLVHKKSEAEDPTLVLLSDKMMQVNLIIWIAVCISVIYFKF